MKRELTINGDRICVDVIEVDDSQVRFAFDGRQYVFLRHKGPASLVIANDNKPYRVQCSRTVRGVQVNIGALEAFVEVPTISRSKKSGAEGSGSLKSPMPGNIFKIFAKEGDRVKKGDKILILEAMKMEHTLTANRDGLLTKLFFAEGDQVEGDVELAAITAKEDAEGFMQKSEA